MDAFGANNCVLFFKIEIQQALSPFFFDDHQKLSCITSAMHLIKILTADSQRNLFVYKLIENFYNELTLNDIIYTKTTYCSFYVQII